MIQPDRVADDVGWKSVVLVHNHAGIIESHQLSCLYGIMPTTMRLFPITCERGVLASAFAVLLLCPGLAFGHGQHEVPRHVAEQGRDAGDCVLPVRPCRTIQYALSLAGKGDRVLVAAGTYEAGTRRGSFLSHQRHSRCAGRFQPLRSFRETGAAAESNHPDRGSGRIPGRTARPGIPRGDGCEGPAR